jgi:hypothetical protein
MKRLSPEGQQAAGMSRRQNKFLAQNFEKTRTKKESCSARLFSRPCYVFGYRYWCTLPVV